MSGFLRKLLGKDTPAPANHAPDTAQDDRISPHFAAEQDDHRRLYAVGDIHGRVDLLDQLHALIAEDAAAAPSGMRSAIIYLGDYIDRGPASRQVIDRLVMDPLAGMESIHICGNHDDLLLRFLEDSAVAPIWLRNGGDATLASYGVTVEEDDSPEALKRMQASLYARLPEEHRSFLRQLRYSYSEGRYFFAHAGARPGTPLEEQESRDLMWIRDEFLIADHDFGKVVVHGHTPVRRVENLSHRIGIDTGAFWTEKLTCAVLHGKERRFLATGESA